MVEAFSFISFRQAFPIEFSRLKQGQSAHDIGAGKGERIPYASVNVGLSRKVDYAVNLLILHQFVECFKVADIHLYELVVRSVLDVLEIRKISGISEFVEIDDFILRIFIYEKSYNMRAYEACSASYYYISHFTIFNIHFLSDSVQ